MNRVVASPGSAASARSAARPTPAPPLTRELRRFSGLTLLTLLLFSLIFPPIDLWPFAFVCLAPWAYAVCRTTRPSLAYWISFFAGWVFFLVNLSWLRPLTGLGFAALAFYLAAYWPLAAFAIRTGLRHGLAPVWTLPVAWVACEFLRGWAMTGFPWLFVGHAFYRQLWLIQIADITGAYGLSFVALMISGWIATLLLARPALDPSRRWRRQMLIGGGATAGLLLGSVAYSLLRIVPTDRLRQGPRVAVVQEDFPLVSTPPYGDPLQVSFARHLVLAASAAASKPDLLVFPETAWGATQNTDFLEPNPPAVEGVPASTAPFGIRCHKATAAFARGDYRAVNEAIAFFETTLPNRALPRLPAADGPPVTVVVGSLAIEAFPEAVYPKFKKFNSALVYDADGSQRPRRYDKNHLVPFGEIVPFRYGRLHFVYAWLNKLSPFSRGGREEYSLTSGAELTVFDLRVGGQSWRFGTPICYEDVMPYVIRHFAWDGPRRRVDFLINMSNDGWFQYSPELPQHLAICVFRAVENRVGFARAVNTGISGFIDPNGRIYSVVETDGRRYGPRTTGFRTDRVLIDDRTSFYGRFGDWFAGLCVAAAVALWASAAWDRWLAATWRHWTRPRAAARGDG